MIEIEKKFILRESDIKNITKNAEFIGEKTYTDTYFDSPDYKLTRKDKWLRLRNSNFDLKLPLNKGMGIDSRQLDQFEEVETDEKIREALNLSGSGNLQEDLENNGYKPFASFTTTRKEYKNGELVIDLDTVDFGYTILEVELLVSDETKMEQAVTQILTFAQKYELLESQLKGKAIEFIKINNQAHYRLLEAAGIL